ncbi:MAG TPA: YtxH domain-containing protein [Vicinamibacterales bacterium]|jgi:gas vesicle protein
MYEPQYSETPQSVQASNGRFLLGLLAGAAVGAAVSLMFAPKSGSELRRELSTKTDRWRRKAAETYGQASETVTDMLSKGRQAAERGREAFQSGREAFQSAREEVIEGRFPGSTGSGSAGL